MTIQKENKQHKNIQISLGILVGYLIAGSLNMMIFDKSFQEAFSDSKIVYSFGGIILSIIIYKISKNSNNKKQNND